MRKLKINLEIDLENEIYNKLINSSLVENDNIANVIVNYWRLMLDNMSYIGNSEYCIMTRVRHKEYENAEYEKTKGE